MWWEGLKVEILTNPFPLNDKSLNQVFVFVFGCEDSKKKKEEHAYIYRRIKFFNIIMT